MSKKLSGVKTYSNNIFKTYSKNLKKINSDMLESVEK